MTTSIDEIVRALGSHDVEEVLRALEGAAKGVERLVEAAVGSLTTNSCRYLIAERLPLLGHAVVPHLRALVARTDADEVRVLASLVLAQLKDTAGVGVLLADVQRGSYAGLSAAKLAQLGVVGADEAIIERLRATALNDIDLIVMLVLALRETGATPRPIT